MPHHGHLHACLSCLHGLVCKPSCAAAEEGILPDKGLPEGPQKMARVSVAKEMAISERGGAEFLHAVESTRAIKVHTAAVLHCLGQMLD